ncbi:MAG: TolC family protein, partial [Bacteroides sp.]
MKKKTILLLYLILATSLLSYAQREDTLRLNLASTIQLATNKSLSSFRAKNMYMASYWEYRSFRADRLPSLTLNMTPLRYNRDFTRRYDSQQDIDVYRKQRSLYTYGALAIQQNLDWTGGTFFIDSELGYLRNFGDNQNTQYSSVPFRLGYRQRLLGYNPFKWEKRIEPVKFEYAKKKLIVDLEQTAEIASTHFFDLAMAQSEY